MKLSQSNYPIEDNSALLAEIEKLKAENIQIRKEKADLETMMEMASNHADEIGADLLDKVDSSIKEIEERVRLISETIPVPILIAALSNGKFLFVNQHSCSVFGLSADEFHKYKAGELYENPSDRHKFINILNEHGHVNNFQVRLKKANGEPFWAALFSQPMNFNNEPCVLTVIYDLTERRQAEEEIRRLTEELIQREEKYLMFSLAGQDFGIHLLKIKEIISMIPLNPVPNMPDFIKGIANLRGRLMPVVDLRIRFGLESTDHTDRTCIIVIEIKEKSEKRQIGVIVDSVTEIIGFKGKDIDPPPKFGIKIDLRFITGMAKAAGSVKILLDIANIGDDFWR